MSKGKSPQTAVTGSFGHLRELFGDDVETRINNKEIVEQSCIVKGCSRKFWVPYGRHPIEGGNVNRGTCNADCERGYQTQLKEKALAAEAAFLAGGRTQLLSSQDDAQPQAA